MWVNSPRRTSVRHMYPSLAGEGKREEAGSRQPCLWSIGISLTRGQEWVERDLHPPVLGMSLNPAEFCLLPSPSSRKWVISMGGRCLTSGAGVASWTRCSKTGRSSAKQNLQAYVFRPSRGREEGAFLLEKEGSLSWRPGLVISL